MKKFFTVLQFELLNYFKNKTYITTTVLIGIVIAIILTLPRFIDMSEFLGVPIDALENQEEQEEISPEEYQNFVLLDQDGYINDMALLENAFPEVKWILADDIKQVKELVENKEVECGFILRSNTEFEYYVLNKGFMDSNSAAFETVLQTIGRQAFCEKRGLDYEEVESAFNQQIQVTEQVLGKDTQKNYWYSYTLIIIAFMMIIFYGVMIATSITIEKSNRSIEVLVTSVNSNCLIFGKVIAGAVAGVVQMTIILGDALISYKINREYWNGMLDMLLDIPAEALITFIFFGLGGFLFYAFCYGAVGALVSKTEDLNKSAGGIQMIIMIVYFGVLMQLQNVDGMIIKVASFLPISSYSAMFARVALGSVEPWEIVVSFIILVISVVAVGIVGAKIYRMGTLRYGNPIKITQALKDLKQK